MTTLNRGQYEAILKEAADKMTELYDHRRALAEALKHIINNYDYLPKVSGEAIQQGRAALRLAGYLGYDGKESK